MCSRLPYDVPPTLAHTLPTYFLHVPSSHLRYIHPILYVPSCNVIAPKRATCMTWRCRRIPHHHSDALFICNEISLVTPSKMLHPSAPSPWVITTHYCQCDTYRYLILSSGLQRAVFSIELRYIRFHQSLTLWDDPFVFLTLVSFQILYRSITCVWTIHVCNLTTMVKDSDHEHYLQEIYKTWKNTKPQLLYVVLH